MRPKQYSFTLTHRENGEFLLICPTTGYYRRGSSLLEVVSGLRARISRYENAMAAATKSGSTAAKPAGKSSASEPHLSREELRTLWRPTDAFSSTSTTPTDVTTRDFFAAHALGGLIADGADMCPKTLARDAYEFADAMLEARK